MPNVPSAPAPSSLIVERPTAGIEIELIRGRRLGFERDVDPDVERRLAIEAEAVASPPVGVDFCHDLHEPHGSSM
jgi:hypothetical protein